MWLDANDNLRSKIKITDDYDLAPLWNFVGSSTGQAEGFDSDVILKPVRYYKNPFYKNHNSNIVLCECLNKDMTTHETNYRNNCEKIYKKYNENNKCLFGIEQEYVIYQNNGIPYKWFSKDMPLENVDECVQGEFYCAVGSNKAFGREISDKHLEFCLIAGVHICGTNAEVAPSQWEFQIGSCDMLTVSDDLIVA